MQLIMVLAGVTVVMMLFMRGTAIQRSTFAALSDSEYYYNKNIIYAYSAILIFCAAFRKGFVDTSTYRKLFDEIGIGFDSITDKSHDIEAGFNFLMIMLKRISANSQSLIIVTSIMIIGIDIYVISRYSCDIPFSLYLYFVVNYLTAQNGIRQVLAASIMSLGIVFLIKKKPIPYFLMVLVCSTLHLSALILIPLYFILSGKRWNFGIGIYGGAIAILFAIPSLSTRVMNTLLSDSAYAEYLTNEEQMGMQRLLVALIPIVLVVLYTRYADTGSKENARLSDILINSAVVSFGFTLFGLKMVYFARLSLYFSYTLPLIIPLAIQKSFTKSSAKLIKLLFVIAYAIYFIYQIRAYNSYGYMHEFYLIFGGK